MKPNYHSCCGPARFRWKKREGLAWLLPGMLILLVPKCPACLAGYVALATGIGLSLPVASGLRIAMLVACAITLAVLLGRSLYRFRKDR